MPEPTTRQPLHPAEAARIEAAYGARVKPDQTVAHYARGAGVLWQLASWRDLGPANMRKHHRAQRLSAAPLWQPGQDKVESA